ncbi:peptidase C14, caspase domain-containing protein [Lenzites betulinus]|nr:peptidase C14, caspase domain-containing protein [Lenzites betulinus]
MVKIGPLRRGSSRVDGPVKKALLIGINYVNTPPHAEYTPLSHAQDDTKAFAELLIAKYGYRRENIIMLLDEEEGDSHCAPTRDNILREIRKLVHGARSGDRFVFYYSGHSGQVESPNTEEEDGMDEYLVPVDYWQHPDSEETKKRMILDDKLRKLLVDTLPVDANLTAIFDSCHSGTLLDLDHYLCNNVYYPWISPGFRNQKTLWRQVRRKNGQYMSQAGIKVITKKHPLSASAGRRGSDTTRKTSTSSVRIYQRKRLSEDEVLVMDTSVGIIDTHDGKARQFSIRSQPVSVKRRPSSMLSQLLEGRATRLATGDSARQSTDTLHEEYDVPMCSSPTDMRVCDGWCQKPGHSTDGTSRTPNVVSLSACGDSQMTWDSKRHSFTQALINLLRLEPHQPIKNLVQSLTFQVHDHSRKLHNWSKRRRESWKERSKGVAGDHSSVHTAEPETTLEMVNFTEPQVGSLRALALQEPFNP